MPVNFFKSIAALFLIAVLLPHHTVRADVKDALQVLSGQMDVLSKQMTQTMHELLAAKMAKRRSAFEHEYEEEPESYFD
jgi:hypothetical protein